MSPLARSLLALALAALLRGACARRYLTNQHQPPTTPGVYCDTLEIGNQTVHASKNTIKVNQMFNVKLGPDEYLINIIDYCSELHVPSNKIGVHYVMTRETVTGCANTPVDLLDVSVVFSPVAAVCDLSPLCGNLNVEVNQYCELRAVAPQRRLGYA